MRNTLAMVIAFFLAACGTDSQGSTQDAGTDAIQACTGNEPEGPAGQPICTQGSCTRVGQQYCTTQEYDCPQGEIVTLPGSCNALSVSASSQIYCCN